MYTAKVQFKLVVGVGQLAMPYAMSMVKCALKIFSGHIRPWTQHRKKTPFKRARPRCGTWHL